MRAISETDLYTVDLYCDDFCLGTKFITLKATTTYSYNYCYLPYGTTMFRQYESEMQEAALEKCGINISIPISIPAQTAYPAETAIPAQTAYLAATPIIVQLESQTITWIYYVIGALSLILIIHTVLMIVLFVKSKPKVEAKTVEETPKETTEVPKIFTITVTEPSNSSDPFRRYFDETGSFELSDEYFKNMDE